MTELMSIDENNLIKIAYHINSDIDLYAENIEIDKTYNGRIIGKQIKKNFCCGEFIIYKIGNKFYKAEIKKNNGNLYFNHNGKRIYNNEIFLI